MPAPTHDAVVQLSAERNHNKERVLSFSTALGSTIVSDYPQIAEGWALPTYRLTALLVHPLLSWQAKKCFTFQDHRVKILHRVI